MKTFVVEDFFYIKDRGPIITRSDAASKRAKERGEVWELGDEMNCGWLTATIIGIECFAIFDPPQGGLLLRGIDLTQLQIGQTWTLVEP